MSALSELVAKNRRILALLDDPKMRGAVKDDVVEFITSMTLVESTLLAIDRVGDCNSILIGEISNGLDEYEKRLLDLKKQNRLVRFLTNNRLRKNLDRINSRLCLQVKNLEDEVVGMMEAGWKLQGAAPLQGGAASPGGGQLYSSNPTPMGGAMSPTTQPQFNSHPAMGSLGAVSGDAWNQGAMSPTLTSNYAPAVTESSPNNYAGGGYAPAVTESTNYANNDYRADQFSPTAFQSPTTATPGFQTGPQAEQEYTAPQREETYTNMGAPPPVPRRYSPAVSQEVIGGLEWTRMFGAQEAIVRWDEFCDRLRDFTALDTIQEFVLKDILDHANTGNVNRFKFCEFLKGFGPFESCVNTMMHIYHQTYFHGFLTQLEARKFLELEPVGTFIVRFSSSRPGSFVIEYVVMAAAPSDPDEYGVIAEDGFLFGPNLIPTVNSVVLETSRSGIHVQTSTGGCDFESLDAVIAGFSSCFNTPFDTTLPKEPWFHGDLTSEEVEELLRGQPPGTFLIRFSSQPGCFASSFVTDKNTIGKSLISRVDGGYQITQSTNDKIYPSIKELVRDYIKANFFKMPLHGNDHTSVTAEMMTPGSRKTPGWVTQSTLQRIQRQQEMPRAPQHHAPVAMRPPQDQGTRAPAMTAPSRPASMGASRLPMRANAASPLARQAASNAMRPLRQRPGRAATTSPPPSFMPGYLTTARASVGAKVPERNAARGFQPQQRTDGGGQYVGAPPKRPVARPGAGATHGFRPKRPPSYARAGISGPGRPPAANANRGMPPQRGGANLGRPPSSSRNLAAPPHRPVAKQPQHAYSRVSPPPNVAIIQRAAPPGPQRVPPKRESRGGVYGSFEAPTSASRQNTRPGPFAPPVHRAPHPPAAALGGEGNYGKGSEVMPPQGGGEGLYGPATHVTQHAVPPARRNVQVGGVGTYGLASRVNETAAANQRW